MTEASSNKEYFELVDGFSFNEALQAFQNVNQSRYPERYEYLKNLLKDKFSYDTSQPKPKPAIKEPINPEVKFAKGIKNAKIIYITGLLFTILLFAINFSRYSKEVFSQELFFIIVSIIIISGIHLKKNWGRILCLICSYLFLIPTFLSVVYYPADFLLQKIIWFFWASLFIYLIILLSKQPAKKYFGAHGEVLISKV